jgi:BASS family bile acid:Na+ symporter
MLQRTLVLWLCLVSLAAFFWNDWLPGASDPFDPRSWRVLPGAWLLPSLITVTMLAIGMMLPRDEVRQVLRRWPTVLGGTTVQYVTMPALAYAAAHLWGLSGDYLVGVIMVGCVPGAMASNVLTLNARGNTSYSVSLTTCATLLSPLAVPLILGLTLHMDKEVDILFLLDASRKLLLTVVVPVVTGHLIALRFPDVERAARRVGPLIANLAVLWIIAVIVGMNRGPLSSSAEDVPLLHMLTALLAVNAIGYVVGYGSGCIMRLPEPMRRALTLEIGMQNAGIGAYLATQLFPGREAIAIAPAMYTFGCMLTGTVLAGVWSFRTPASETKHSP